MIDSGPALWLARAHSIIVKPRLGVYILVVFILALLIAIVVGKASSAQTTQEAQNQLGRVASPVAAQCASDPAVRARLGEEVCNAAQQAADPMPGPRGPAGTDGRDGRGIVATVIRADGHLLVTYTDGAKIDVGPVVGQAGVAGRGIAYPEIKGGHLVLHFTDGGQTDLGAVLGEKGSPGIPGKNGRGVASTAIVNNRLIVTYDDGTTNDAGPVPTGVPAPPAVALDITRIDGTRVLCSRSGGDDAHPTYACAPA